MRGYLIEWDVGKVQYSNSQLAGTLDDVRWFLEGIAMDARNTRIRVYKIGPELVVTERMEEVYRQPERKRILEVRDEDSEGQT